MAELRKVSSRTWSKGTWYFFSPCALCTGCTHNQWGAWEPKPEPSKNNFELHRSVYTFFARLVISSSLIVASFFLPEVSKNCSTSLGLSFCHCRLRSNGEIGRSNMFESEEAKAQPRYWERGSFQKWPNLELLWCDIGQHSEMIMPDGADGCCDKGHGHAAEDKQQAQPAHYGSL